MLTSLTTVMIKLLNTSGHNESENMWQVVARRLGGSDDSYQNAMIIIKMIFPKRE